MCVQLKALKKLHVFSFKPEKDNSLCIICKEQLVKYRPIPAHPIYYLKSEMSHSAVYFSVQ